MGARSALGDQQCVVRVRRAWRSGVYKGQQCIVGVSNALWGSGVHGGQQCIVGVRSAWEPGVHGSVCAPVQSSDDDIRCPALSCSSISL